MITTDKIRFLKGWNRLLVWMHSPALINGQERKFASETQSSNWTMQFAITGTQENDIDNIRFSAFDPTRTTMLTSDNQPMRFCAEFRRPDGESPIFFVDEPVNLVYKLLVEINTQDVKERKPWSYTVTPQTIMGMMEKRDSKTTQYRIAPSAQRFSLEKFKDNLPTKLVVKIVDYDDRPVFQKTLDLSFESENDGVFEAKQSLTLGLLPVNHYTIFTEYRNHEDQVILRNSPHSFSVVSGPVDRSLDTGDRVLSTVGHWLVKNDIKSSLGRLRFLWRAGVTRQQKLNQSWSAWGISHDGKGNVTFTPNPNIDAAIDEANRLGITVVGDLSTGFILSDRIRDGRFPPNTEAEQKELQAKSQAITDPGQLVLCPYGVPLLPPFGTKAFDKTLHDYAVALVSHYKGRVDYWSGDNETDLHAGKASEQIARVYAGAVKVLYRSMKEANPNAKYVSPSLCRKNDFTGYLQKWGFMDACDILDVHAHPINPPDMDSPVIGNSTQEGLGVVIDYVTQQGKQKPVWYGELSAPASHHVDGVRGQVSSLLKQLAWAINNEHVNVLSYLVMYNGYDYRWPSGMCNAVGEPLPVINAINTASHLLDGRKKMSTLPTLKASIEQLRVVDKEGKQTLLLWNHAPTTVWLKVKKTCQQIDALGIHKTNLEPDAQGMVQVLVDQVPVYVVGQFLDQ
ncbi:hypothetical protein JYU15_00705 [bacterium AH-315-I18]|nr:hypothetical protein [bacterium AH-315-I18]